MALSRAVRSTARSATETTGAKNSEATAWHANANIQQTDAEE